MITLLGGTSKRVAAWEAVQLRATQAGYTMPSSAQQDALQTVISSLQAAGIWAKLDLLAILKTTGQREFALINLRNPTIVGEIVNPQPNMFNNNVGFTGDGIASHLRWQFDPAFGANWQLPTGFIASWESTNVLSASNPSIGLANSATMLLSPRNGSSGISFRHNRGSTVSVNNIGIVTSVGLTAVNRSTLDDITLYKNGTSVGTAVVPASALGGGDLCALRGSTGVTNVFSTRTVQIVAVGASLTAAEHLAFYNALNTYMQT